MEQEKNLETTQNQDKNIAIIAYLTIIGLIIAFILNNDKKDKFTNFHIQQSLGIAVIALGFFVIGMIPVLGWIISFLGFFLILFLWIMGLINAINGRENPVPFFGEKFIDWFKNI
ncbi:MAG: hypothetical protein V3U80_08390 [Flavobacteriaceae bacterium]